RLVLLPESAPPKRAAVPIDAATTSLIQQGKHLWHQRTRGSVERAIAYFTRAADRSARAAEAWCGLAYSWVVMAGRGYVSVAVAAEHAVPSADRALRLDDTLSSVHSSLGGLNILRRRWHDAEREFRHAIELDARNAD